MEAELAKLEAEEKALQAEVMKGGLSADKVQKGYERLGQLAERIAAVMSDWESAAAKLEEVGE